MAESEDTMVVGGGEAHHAAAAGEEGLRRRQNRGEKEQEKEETVKHQGAAAAEGKGTKKGAAAHVPGTPSQTKLLCIIMLGPIVALAVLYPSLVWFYHEPDPITLCTGVCNITDAALSAAPQGCLPSSPLRLFYTHIPNTAGLSFKALAKDRRHDKGWQIVDVKIWRDAVMQNPIFMAPVMRMSKPPSYYEGVYVSGVAAQSLANRTHRHLMYGKCFMFDVHNKDDQVSIERSESIKFLTMMRRPKDRLRSMYMQEEERLRVKRVHQGVNDKSVHRPSFEECAASEECRQEHKFSRWCNIQTRFLCGWGPDCRFNSRDNATLPMLERAVEHLKTRYLAIGLTEHFDQSVAMFEKLLPTYFEGATDLLRKECPEGAANAANGKATPCKYGKPGYTPMTEPFKFSPDVEEALRTDCWADNMIYDFAREKFESHVRACPIPAAA